MSSRIGDVNESRKKKKETATDDTDYAAEEVCCLKIILRWLRVIIPQ